jgi:hypothetical protein
MFKAFGTEFFVVEAVESLSGERFFELLEEVLNRGQNVSFFEFEGKTVEGLVDG